MPTRIASYNTISRTFASDRLLNLPRYSASSYSNKILAYQLWPGSPHLSRPESEIGCETDWLLSWHLDSLHHFAYA